MVPGVRSLISIPAGASRMNLVTFSIYTIIGSGLWNALLLGVGAALGTQHEKLEQYLGYLDYAVYSAIAIALVVLVRASHSRGVGRAEDGRAGGRTERGCAPAGTRTQTEAILSRPASAIGLRGPPRQPICVPGCDAVPSGVIRSPGRP